MASAAVPEFIKISEQLTCAADTVGPRSAIRAILSFADHSGGEVVAEGLETSAHIDLMMELGVRLGQGFALGMPDDAERWCTGDQAGWARTSAG